jgi:S-DNA-T family DNA segregation ATPase FtsK/SpoIIIE
MAKKSNEATAKTTTEKVSKSWQINRQQKFAIGVLFILFAATLLLSFVSYFITGNFDQSHAGEFLDRNATVDNWLGKFGAYLAHFFMYSGFGVASFLFIRVIFMIGAYLILDMALGKLKKTLFWDFYIIIVLSILLGFFWDFIPQLSGVVGYEMNLFVQDYIGKIGTLFTLIFAIILFLIFKINLSLLIQ